jgi:hypothetical protein
VHQKTTATAKIVRRGALAALVSVAVLALVLVSLGTAQALTKRDRSATNGVIAPQQERATMVDHGGSVLPTAHVHVIWWGAAASFPSDERATVQGLLSSLDGTAYLATADAYLRGATAHVSYDPATDWSDPSTPPADATADDVAAEVTRYLAVTHAAADPKAVYVVYSTARVSGDECAWHDARAVSPAGGATLVNLAYVPDATGAAHCDLGVAASAASAASLSAASSTAHELVETMTDPIPGATWTTSTSAADEIADPCSSEIHQVRLAGTLSLPLQGIWSNATRTCVTG